MTDSHVDGAAGAECVVKFPRASVMLDGVPDSEIVERLEALLARARRGEIAGLAYLVITPGSAVMFDWLGDAPGSLFGYGIALLQQDFLNVMLGEAETIDVSGGPTGSAG